MDHLEKYQAESNGTTKANDNEKYEYDTINIIHHALYSRTSDHYIIFVRLAAMKFSERMKSRLTSINLT